MPRWAALLLGVSYAAWSLRESRARANPGARDSPGALARALQNPIEDMITVPVELNLDYGVGAYDRANGTLKVEPRGPIHVRAGWNIATRTIVPIMNQANQNAATGGSSGLGDVNPTFFLSPARTGPFLWGFGPDFVLPTATQTSLGTGKWSAGPALALVFRPKRFSLAVIASNVWSFAGASGKPSVNEGSLQYLGHYGFGDGWSLNSSPTITAEWNNAAGDVWEVPVGGGLARVIRWRDFAIAPGLAAYDYVMKRSDSPDWELRCEVSFLFPQ
jgi:hypothetical protein